MSEFAEHKQELATYFHTAYGVVRCGPGVLILIAEAKTELEHRRIREAVEMMAEAHYLAGETMKATA